MQDKFYELCETGMKIEEKLHPIFCNICGGLDHDEPRCVEGNIKNIFGRSYTRLDKLKFVMQNFKEKNFYFDGIIVNERFPPMSESRLVNELKDYFPYSSRKGYIVRLTVAQLQLDRAKINKYTVPDIRRAKHFITDQIFEEGINLIDEAIVYIENGWNRTEVINASEALTREFMEMLRMTELREFDERKDIYEFIRRSAKSYGAI